MSSLRRAIEIAFEAHEGQTRIGGEAFVNHPMRVAVALSNRGYSSWVLQAAWLHDVVEDTPWTLDDLRREGFGARTVDLVDALTRREGETYFQYIDRVCLGPISTEVKIEDNGDNSNPESLQHIDAADRAWRVKRYAKALVLLQAARSSHVAHFAPLAAA